ncbi:MAG: F0F1 ATP synthase subunit A [Prevotellaceae bacterium]|nr:F0F1 ATP synthase subunit A [Prevotellaceae bacterium]MDY6130187.1 F0F1 ATP synthase subunit A [Prevotella sp.]
MKHIKQLLFLMVMTFMTLEPAAASNSSKDGEFDLQRVLWGHVKDNYEWHITDIGDTKLIIHLPVIVHSSTGWHFFMSDQIEEEPIESGKLKGYRACPEGTNLHVAPAGGIYENKIVEVQPDGTEVRPFDISITKTIVVLFIDAIILLLCVLIPARWAKRHNAKEPAEKGFVGFMNMFITYIYDEVIKPSLGEESDKFAPYLLTCFFFIFIANIMGIIPFPPGGGNLTGNIAVTFFLALCTFFITNISGTKHYWKDIFWPDVPWWLKVPIPLMPAIEVFSIFTKPLALMVRLFANMLAGHAIAISLTCIIFIMASLGAFATGAMTVVSVALSVFMMLLEVLVCFIQALVFTMLSTVFISLARIKEHEA